MYVSIFNLIHFILSSLLSVSLCVSYPELQHLPRVWVDHVVLSKPGLHHHSLTHTHICGHTHTQRGTQRGSFRCGMSNITSLRQNARNSALLEKHHIFVCVCVSPSTCVCVCVCQGVLEAGRGLAEQKRANLSALPGQTTLLTLIQRHIDSPLHPTGEGVCVCLCVQECVSVCISAQVLNTA